MDMYLELKAMRVYEIHTLSRLFKWREGKVPHSFSEQRWTKKKKHLKQIRCHAALTNIRYFAKDFPQKLSTNP